MNFAQAVDALADATRGNKTIADMLGVTVNLTELPSWTEYQGARDRHNCGKTKKQLRRLFVPLLNLRYGREFIEAQIKLQHEFIDVVMNEVRE